MLTLDQIGNAAGASVVVAIFVQLLKAWVPERLVPHASVGVGIVVVLAATIAQQQTSPDLLGNAVLQGILAGAAAVGLYQLQRPAALLRAKGQSPEPSRRTTGG